MDFTSVVTTTRATIEIERLRHLLAEWNVDRHWLGTLADARLEREFDRICRIKRTMERGQADERLRELMRSNFAEAARVADLDVSADEVQFLLQPNIAVPEGFQAFMSVQSEWEKFIVGLAGSSSNLNYRKWRERQIARCHSQVYQGSQTQHFPVSFELSKGCSVGCWFCGVAAPSLGDIFFYTPENARLWQDLLELMKQTLGASAGAGFCYCATDPLDNPDYELFMSDFHRILGVFPQTTTAQPLKNPDRTRALLKLAIEKGCLINRFSIISLKLLEKVHREFSAQELAFAGLVLQNPESGLAKSISGRARERAQRQADRQQEMLDDTHAGTTACVSGFLINLIDRTVKLISPHNASDRWPLGYKIYEQGTFENPSDLQSFLTMAIDKHMPIEVRDADRLQFRNDLNYERLPDGFQLASRYFTHKFRHGDYLHQLGEILCQGNKTVAEILQLFEILGTPAEKIRASLNLMFDRGVFDEDGG